MTIQEKAAELALYESNAGEEGWGGELRETLADGLLDYLQIKPHPTLHGLLDHLLAQLEQGHSAL